MLFRKSKVLKILKEYSRVYDVVIDGIGAEELEALKQIELKSLALVYDSLKGYEYFTGHLDGIELSVNHHLPSYSRAYPNFSYVKGTATGIQKLVRRYKNQVFLKGTDYVYRIPIGVLIPAGGTKWNAVL
jgi:hypothetical protein